MEKPTLKVAVTAALAGLIVAASVVFELSHDDRRPAPPQAPAPPTADQLDAELERCNRLGPDDKPDQACLDAWTRARAHFFGSRP